MRIEFYGIYRLSIGVKTVGLELPHNATIYNALQAISQRFPILQDKMFDQNGDLCSYQPLYINGRNPRLLADGLHTVVRADDVLSIFSPISSGCINVEDVKKAQNS